MKTNEQQSAELDQLTILSRQTVIRGGSFEVGHDVTIRGTLEGEVKVAGRIDVLHGAEVDGSVEASEAVIAGTVRGDLTVAGMLTLRSTAVVEGSVRAGSIAVEDGASGGVTMAAGTEAATESSEIRRRAPRRELGEALARARAAVAAAKGEPVQVSDPAPQDNWHREIGSDKDSERRTSTTRSTDRMLSSPEMQEFLPRGAGAAAPERSHVGERRGEEETG